MAKGKKLKLATGQTVGVVVGGALKRHLKGSKHFLNVPFRSIAFLEEHLQQATGWGADHVEVIDDETGAVYVAPIQDICERGFLVNRGWGKQIAMPLDKFERLAVGE